MGWFNPPLILIPVFILVVPAALWLAGQKRAEPTGFWLGDRQAERRQLRVICRRFGINALLLLLIISVWFPQDMFNLPRNMTLFWLGLIVIYPVLSVYPQELLYRAFFFSRYRLLFANPLYLVLSNAVLFGWMHIVFHNMVAVVFSFVGGMLFAQTYHRTRSLRLVSLEHSMYGMLIFTLGYGESFLYKPWLQQLGAE